MISIQGCELNQNAEIHGYTDINGVNLYPHGVIVDVSEGPRKTLDAYLQALLKYKQSKRDSMLCRYVVKFMSRPLWWRNEEEISLWTEELYWALCGVSPEGMRFGTLCEGVSLVGFFLNDSEETEEAESEFYEDEGEEGFDDLS